jgi:hypothetical protein
MHLQPCQANLHLQFLKLMYINPKHLLSSFDCFHAVCVKLNQGCNK